MKMSWKDRITSAWCHLRGDVIFIRFDDEWYDSFDDVTDSDGTPRPDPEPEPEKTLETVTVDDINIDDVVAYLGTLHCALWGRFFEVTREKEKVVAAVFIMETICGILRVAEERQA